SRPASARARICQVEVVLEGRTQLDTNRGFDFHRAYISFFRSCQLCLLRVPIALVGLPCWSKKTVTFPVPFSTCVIGKPQRSSVQVKLSTVKTKVDGSAACAEAASAMAVAATPISSGTILRMVSSCPSGSESSLQVPSEIPLLGVSGVPLPRDRESCSTCPGTFRALHKSPPPGPPDRNEWKNSVEPSDEMSGVPSSYRLFTGRPTSIGAP